MATHLTTVHVRGIVMCKRQENLYNPRDGTEVFQGHTGWPIREHFTILGCTGIAGKAGSVTSQVGCRRGLLLCEMDPV